VALLLLAGLQSIPASVHEAARVDGASEWTTFREVKLPLIRRSVLIALLFRTLDAFRVFDSIYVLTQGGPANTTETLSIYTYKTMMRSGDFGYGSTLAVATFLCIALISLLYLSVFRAGMGERS
jgi:multiple sugar transport system permease protein